MNKIKNQFGSILTEVLMSIALATLMIPIIVRHESTRVREIENATAARELSDIRDALGRYISANSDTLFGDKASVFKVTIDDLADYGLTAIPEKNDVQLRIAKTRTRSGDMYLQGLVVMDIPDMDILRTHEIAAESNATAGFTSGASRWRATFSDGSLSDVTAQVAAGGAFLRRSGGGTSILKSDLDMSGYAIENVKSVDSDTIGISGQISSENITASEMVFDGMAALDGALKFDRFTARNNVSSDGGAIVADELYLNGAARFRDVLAYDLRVGNLSLAGISDGTGSELSVSGAADVADGRITAGAVVVGGSGSITPHLTVTSKISNSPESPYFWDIATGEASIADMSLQSLVPMVRSALNSNRAQTSAYNIMSRVSANANATTADFLNALDEIESVVRTKYNQLKAQ
jgi:hypothetical protein